MVLGDNAARESAVDVVGDPDGFVDALDLDVAKRTLKFALADVKSHLVVLEAGTDFDGLGVGDDPVEELIVDVGVGDGPGAGRAGLAGAAEGAVRDGLDGGVEIGAGRHDGGVFPAHLTLDALLVFGGVVVDGVADRGAPGKGDRIDAVTRDDLVADLAAGAGNEVEGVVGKASLLETLDDRAGDVER